MRKIVFDIETKNTFEDAASGNPADLDVSVVGTYDYETGEYRAFLEEDFPQLRSMLQRADLLIGFNSDHFDIPALEKHFPGLIGKKRSLDLLHEIKQACGRRASLNSVAAATLGTKKSGYGLDAVTWWRRGEIEKLKQYCLDDVRITKDVYEFALANGYLNFEHRGGTNKVVLNTSRWEESPAASQRATLF